MGIVSNCSLVSVLLSRILANVSPNFPRLVSKISRFFHRILPKKFQVATKISKILG